MACKHCGISQPQHVPGPLELCATTNEFVAAVPLAIGAGALALSTYLDAKFHISHDIRFLATAPSASDAVQYITAKARENRLLVAHILEERATDPSTANRIFLVFPSDGRQWTYGEFWRDVCRVGNWLVEGLGVRKNELVALNGGNSPEYLMLWFGLDAAGACPAFINCNLSGQALEHCVKVG